MRFALAVLLILSGCAEISGLDGLDVCDGACVDVTIDAPQTPDSGVDADDGSSIVDAKTKDAPNDSSNDSPSDAISAPDGATAPCVQPSDCKSGQVCCETLVTKGNFFPSCTVDADTIACTAASACPTTVGFNCGTDLLRRCTDAGDCTEPAAPKCCKFGDGGATREVCLSAQTASLVNATCL